MAPRDSKFPLFLKFYHQFILESLFILTLNVHFSCWVTQGFIWNYFGPACVIIIVSKVEIDLGKWLYSKMMCKKQLI